MDIILSYTQVWYMHELIMSNQRGVLLEGTNETYKIHKFRNLIESFIQAIRLWMVGCGDVMVQSGHFQQLPIDLYITCAYAAVIML